jgi:hypothetical protein
MTLPNGVKERLEEVVNDWLLRFDAIAEAELEFLERIGIEPTLETLLSYTAGVMDSIVGSYIDYLYGRGTTLEEDEELVELIKGKIPELEIKFEEFLKRRGKG